jgi:phosphohistidine phosphatase
MELILWRHAHAESGFPDLTRPLSARGEEEARAAAQWLNEHLFAHSPALCRILVSPARRTQQTAAMLKRPYETVAALSTDANTNDLLAAVGWQPKEKAKEKAEEKSITLVVGHQPTLGEAATFLLGESRWTPKTGSLCWLKAVGLAEKALAGKTLHAQATLAVIFTP